MLLLGIIVARRLMLRFLSVSNMDGRPAHSGAMVVARGIFGCLAPYFGLTSLSIGLYDHGEPNHALHRTAAKRFSFDAPDFSDAGFAASARFRRRSVS